jgi:hypothetical protein
MSADHNPKYSVSKRGDVLPDGTALSDHARHRYRERTPHDCDVSITTAYSRAESIKHPVLVRTTNEDRVPARALVYQHAHEWDTIFIIHKTPGAYRDADEIVVTVVTIHGYSHGPTRAYLSSHGPHNPGGVDP